MLKLLGMWAAGQALGRVPAVRHYTNEIILLVIAVLATAMLLGATVVGAFYGEYLLLTQIANLSPNPAFAITWLTGALMVALGVLLIGYRIRSFMRVMDLIKRLKSPVAYYTDPVIDSFLDGFNGKKKPKREGDADKNSIHAYERERRRFG